MAKYTLNVRWTRDDTIPDGQVRWFGKDTLWNTSQLLLIYVVESAYNLKGEGSHMVCNIDTFNNIKRAAEYAQCDLDKKVHCHLWCTKCS